MRIVTLRWLPSPCGPPPDQYIIRRITNAYGSFPEAKTVGVTNDLVFVDTVKYDYNDLSYEIIAKNQYGYSEPSEPSLMQVSKIEDVSFLGNFFSYSYEGNSFSKNFLINAVQGPTALSASVTP